jgi:hypothetical protein
MSEKNRDQTVPEAGKQVPPRRHIRAAAFTFCASGLALRYRDRKGTAPPNLKSDHQ